MVEWVWDLYGTGRLLEAAVDPKICPNFVQEEMECLMLLHCPFCQQKCLWQHTLHLH
ncbi:hypothetical protein CsSME_00048018 [Camellia sinensis var. sinensis]